MEPINLTDQIWNRACGFGVESDAPRIGDHMLEELISFHSAVMNGGVLHAVSLFDTDKSLAIAEGFRFFGYDSVGDFILETRDTLEKFLDGDSIEAFLDEKYLSLVPDDSDLLSKLREKLAESPELFALV